MIEDTLGLSGTVVAEKYEVLEAVGRGGFAIVYRARHLMWKRPVALKVFKALEGASRTDRQALMDDLVKEASLLAELSEKTASICQARDLGMLVSPGGQSLPYMVLEWLEGKTLGATLVAEQGALLPPRSLAASIALLDPVAEALAVAHTRGIAHRDVKPANVFLSMDAEGKTLSVKLLDFGIAKVVQDAQKNGGAFEKTAGEVTAFTPSYGAPEQFSRKFGATGPWTDVFSLALVVVECAAGRRIAPGNDVLELAKIAVNAHVRPTPRTLGVDVSDATEAVFAQALAVQTSQRFPTAGAFWIALLASVGVEPSRALLAATAEERRNIFAGLQDVTSVPSAGAVSARTAPAAPAQPPAPRASGKTTLAAILVLGVFFVAALVFGLRYSQKQDAADAAAADLAAREAARETASAGRALAGAASSPPAGSASGSATSACPDGMVLIPRGEFFMGSDDDTEIEKPAHHVDLSPYCIDLYEVTTTRYVACSDAGKCKRAYRTNEWPEISAHDRDAYDPLCSVREPTMQADHPINCVDWEMASTFCRSLPGGRLPTEAEWEYAARGPDGRRYPWGDEPPGPTYLNACGSECVAWGKSVKAPMSAMYRGDDGWPTTSAVGSFPRGKSRFGLFDVAGNVWEWVADWQAPYGKTAVQDPKGPDSGKLKVVRGGAWNGALEGWVRPTFRFMNTPESRSFGIGFRCAATPR